ncbi:hypothetical protein C8Q73DRAFT_422076 [Cubamyces lactineus]|nr:hypothetical protein C8Q73DRAFT_422076 [Cubamyces lactineus]
MHNDLLALLLAIIPLLRAKVIHQLYSGILRLLDLPGHLVTSAHPRVEPPVSHRQNHDLALSTGCRSSGPLLGLPDRLHLDRWPQRALPSASAWRPHHTSNPHGRIYRVLSRG